MQIYGEFGVDYIVRLLQISGLDYVLYSKIELNSVFLTTITTRRKDVETNK